MKSTHTTLSIHKARLLTVNTHTMVTLLFSCTEKRGVLLLTSQWVHLHKLVKIVLFIGHFSSRSIYIDRQVKKKKKKLTAECYNANNTTSSLLNFVNNTFKVVLCGKTVSCPI